MRTRRRGAVVSSSASHASKIAGTARDDRDAVVRARAPASRPDGSGRRATRPRPPCNARPSTTFSPKTWKSGSTPSATSSASMRRPGCACICSMFASSEPCVSIAGFGAPAVPAVNSSTARSSSARVDRRERVGRELVGVVGVVDEQRHARSRTARTRGAARSASSGDATTSAGSTTVELARELVRRRRTFDGHRDRAGGERREVGDARTRARCRRGARPGRRAATGREPGRGQAPASVRERAVASPRSGATTATRSGAVLAACRSTAPRFTRAEATSRVRATVVWVPTPGTIPRSVVNLVAQGSRGPCRYLVLQARADRQAAGTGRPASTAPGRLARDRGSGRGCGRVVAPGSPGASTQRSLPARPKTSALRPDPDTRLSGRSGCCAGDASLQLGRRQLRLTARSGAVARHGSNVGGRSASCRQPLRRTTNCDQAAPRIDTRSATEHEARSPHLGSARSSGRPADRRP